MLLQGALARTAACSYKCTNAMTGDFPLIIGFIFDLFLGKPYSMPSEHLEYGMSCLGRFYVCKKFGKVSNLLNGQVQVFFVFFDNVLICDLKKIR